MDIATRLQPRARAQGHLNREKNSAPHDDSGGESADSLANQRAAKYARTGNATDTADVHAFRKPSAPASATKAPGQGGERNPSITTRRKPTLRENVRVPSGPRELPRSPSKRIGSHTHAHSTSNSNPNHNPNPTPPASTPATAQPPSAAANSRSFSSNHSLPPTSKFSEFRGRPPAAQQPQHSSTDETDSPTTPAEKAHDGFDFVPTMNFDDFQSSITDPNWTSPLLSEFPTHSGGRALPKEPEPKTTQRADTMPRGPGTSSLQARVTTGGRDRQENDGSQATEGKQGGHSRSVSFRKKLVSGQPSAAKNQTLQQKAQDQSLPPSASQPHLSVRTKRQNTMPSSTTTPSLHATPPAGNSASRAPRKSITGSAAISNAMSERHGSGSKQAPNLTSNLSSDAASPHQQSAPKRTTSLSKSRHPNVHHTNSAENQDLPRLAPSTANTQSRAARVKSMQPPPRDANAATNLNLYPDTPDRADRAGRGAKSQGSRDRALTPSSGNSASKRQSTVSGRASGLGARTISPTDARRIKRMSMANAPPMPMPSANLPKASGPPTPNEDLQHNSAWPAKAPGAADVPRMAQPSPSFIPRRTSNNSGSARASPERVTQFPNLPSTVQSAWPDAAAGGVTARQARPGSLSSKSSYQSLLSRDNSSSRLPTPKPRSGSTASLSRQDNQFMTQSQDDNELVPPVPAIPKAYESPKEYDSSQYFPSPSGKSLGLGVESSDFDSRGSLLPPSAPATANPSPRGSLELTRQSVTEGKRSGEFNRAHKRQSTLGVPSSALASSGAATTAGSRMASTSSRPQPDPAGRRNNNLQPLRLPPLNLMPLSNKFPSASSQQQQQPQVPKTPASLPHPTKEVEQRQGYNTAHTPEPRRMATKTPSTPMTASKATFWKRHDEAAKGLRSSSSHHALRDATGGFEDPGMSTRFFDDSSDPDTAGGVGVGGKRSSGMPISGKKLGRGITPFASGSLPKGSGEFAKLQARAASGDYSGAYSNGNGSVGDDYDLGVFAEHLNLRGAKQRQDPGAAARPKTSGHVSTTQTSAKVGTPSSGESPVVEQPPARHLPEAPGSKKESGGLRRKLSLGWRRSSSKAAQHPEHKSSSQTGQPSPAMPTADTSSLADRAEKQREQKAHETGDKLSVAQQRRSQMPPPPTTKAGGLPTSQTWSGDVSNLQASHLLQVGGTGSARPSLDESKRKSTIDSPQQNATNGEAEQPIQPHPVAAKTRALHSEHGPQPVTSSGSRATSWANFGAEAQSGQRSATNGTSIAKPTTTPKHNKTASSTISAIVKDKDDFSADDEMKRLSQKRRDVDVAAKETEALKARATARPPMSPLSCLHDRHCALNIFERGEIVDYDKDGVFFTGTRNAKKIIGSLTSPMGATPSDGSKNGNYGYDDERGDYNIVLGDHLAYRYEVIDVLGKGSFGQVVRCVDHKDGGIVAVKIIRNKKRFHQQALVEVGILGRLGEWDPDGSYATLSITGSFYFRNHLCIVTPCLSINLYELIRAHNFTGFSLPLIRRFSRQLLACLILLQQKRIIHCDLKPENILLCEARKADVRVIDFGSSCKEEEKVYTYIQSRFYRSPEVILGSSYGLGIDMWSFGCILAELWTGYPIFPGENEQEQLACIMEIFGPPDRHLVERCTRKKLFFDSVGKPRVTVSSKGRRRRPSSKTLAQALKTDDDAFVDFIARCLRWDPDRRMKPSEAISHPFITNTTLNARPGIPDEARRAARARSTAAGPTAAAAANGTNAPASSPVKRNAFAQQQAQTTPAISKTKASGAAPLESSSTPQQTSTIRSIFPSAATNNAPQASPSKPPAGGGAAGNSNVNGSGTRRQSLVPSMGNAAASTAAGSKRGANGAVLTGAGSGGLMPGQRTASGNMAAAAASASMGHGGGSAATSRWRA
ncbi:kinase-like protein [Hortaea werneckii]|nr:kinase-like protein [Hortaea werneckii]